MTRPTTYLLFVFLTYATQGFAQAPPRPTATVIADAPVFATASVSQAPLRVASAGSVLLLIKQEGQWCNIEFQDPQYGRRSGYIETRYLRLSGTAPVDLSTPAVSGQTAAPLQPTSSQQPRQQRGDFAVGWALLHEENITLPLGIVASDAWRVHPHVDMVLEGQYVHGNVDFVTFEVGTNVWSVLGGPRFWGGSRYGKSVGAFGQVLGGFMGVSGNVGVLASASTVGFGIQPGFGVEVPVTHGIAIRPQFDVLISNLEGNWGSDVRFGVNTVFRLFK